MKNLESLKKLIQEAVPGNENQKRPINLEDVLQAIDNVNVNSYWLASKIIKLVGIWELGESLDQQNEKTIDFIYNLLKK